MIIFFLWAILLPLYYLGWLISRLPAQFGESQKRHLLSPSTLITSTAPLQLRRVSIVSAHITNTTLVRLARRLLRSARHRCAEISLATTKILLAGDAASTNILQTSSRLGVGVQLRGGLALDWLAETGVHVCGGGAADGVLGAGAAARCGDRDFVGWVSLEGARGRRRARGHCLCLEFGGVVGW